MEPIDMFDAKLTNSVHHSIRAPRAKAVAAGDGQTVDIKVPAARRAVLSDGKFAHGMGLANHSGKDRNDEKRERRHDGSHTSWK